MEIRVSLSGELAEAVNRPDIAGVGMIRGEFILRNRLLPLSNPMVARELQAYLESTCRLFEGMPVWYRLIDLWSDEAAVLTGARLEAREPNPMLGHRGIRRGLADIRELRRELALVNEVAQSFTNLHLLVPFVQDAEEFSKVTEYALADGWKNRIGAMLEIPSAISDPTSFIQAGASNLLIGLNDLSCLMLGRERGPNNMKLHSALWRAINNVHDTVGNSCEWGIGGSLSDVILNRARSVGVPYASIHYAELPNLVGILEMDLPDLNLVANIKAKTRTAKEQLVLSEYTAQANALTHRIVVFGIIQNLKGQVLLIKNTCDGQWTLPGGVLPTGIDPKKFIKAQILQLCGAYGITMDSHPNVIVCDTLPSSLVFGYHCAIEQCDGETASHHYTLSNDLYSKVCDAARMLLRSVGL